MAVFQLRLRNETGMGETLWAANDAARSRWLSYVDPEQLPVSEELRDVLNELARLTSLGWQRVVPGQEDTVVAAPEPDDWRKPTGDEMAETDRLRAFVLEQLQRELGSDYAVVP